MLYDRPRPLCSGDCWHYSVFGGDEGCGVQDELSGNPWPELIEPGEECFYPEKRSICKPVLVGDLFSLCAALEGDVIKGGPYDNTKFVQMLIDIDEKS